MISRQRTGRPFARALLSWLALTIGYWVFRAWRASLRVRLVTDPSLAGDPRSRVLCLWHGDLAAALAAPRARPTTALVSLSADGDLGARLLSRSGVEAVRGSSSRGGARGLREVVSALGRGEDVAIAVDGPRGPRGRVSAGALAAARLADAALVPVRVRARHAVTLPTWDLHQIPLPFCQVLVELGAPVTTGEGAAEALAAALEKTLDDMHLPQEAPAVRRACPGPARGGTVPG